MIVLNSCMPRARARRDHARVRSDAWLQSINSIVSNYCGIFEKKFGFYRAELDRFCVIVFGMRARSLSFVGTRPIDLINSFAWQLPEDSDVNQKLPEASEF